jgi:hypothetical protein
MLKQPIVFKTKFDSTMTFEKVTETKSFTGKVNDTKQTFTDTEPKFAQ